MEKGLAKVINDLYGIEVALQLSRPDPEFGDYASNIALQLAKQLGKAPRDIAEEIASALRGTGEFSEVTIAGPGFINMRVSGASLASQLETAWSDAYGQSQDGAGKTVGVE